MFWEFLEGILWTLSISCCAIGISIFLPISITTSLRSSSLTSGTPSICIFLFLVYCCRSSSSPFTFFSSFFKPSFSFSSTFCFSQILVKSSRNLDILLFFLHRSSYFSLSQPIVFVSLS
uniref:Uncharacterized protein n=1 Tax=Cacopsylla melanoneura TaxID=428564 RepID=A0A8D8ZC43_9HEMI